MPPHMHTERWLQILRGGEMLAVLIQPPTALANVCERAAGENCSSQRRNDSCLRKLLSDVNPTSTWMQRLSRSDVSVHVPGRERACTWARACTYLGVSVHRLSCPGFCLLLRLEGSGGL